jgi:hypothetical protein
VCCLAEFLTHVPCLTQVKDNLEHCLSKFDQRKEELVAIMEEQNMKPTNEIDSVRRAHCW